MSFLSSVRDAPVYSCMLVLVTLRHNVVTSQIEGKYIAARMDKYFDFSPTKVITHSSAIECAATCRQTSWCVATNLLSDRRTCQLLSVAAADVTSLESANDWRYLREF